MEGKKGERTGKTNQAMQLMENGPSRPLRCDGGVFEEAALLWED